MLLAGDLGAMKITLALYTDKQALAAPVAEATFSSAHYPSLAAIIGEFLQQQPPVWGWLGRLSVTRRMSPTYTGG